MPSSGISGLAVALAGAGGLLIYAGFRGVTPIKALQEISSGHPTPVKATSTTLEGLDLSQTHTPVSAPSSGVLGAANVLAASAKYQNDLYSKTKRTQPGWSDCSSFCDKILTDVGIPTPVKWASTANYRISSTWKKIAAADAMPGDVAVSSHHMVMVTGPAGSTAVGQQNPRVNVRRGSVKDLMGSQTYFYYRYKG